MVLVSKFPYHSLIFKEKKISKEEAFEKLYSEKLTKYILEEDNKIIINRPYEKCYFDKGDGLSNFYTEKTRMECSFNRKESPLNVFEKIIKEDIKKMKFESYEEIENYIYKNYSKIYKVCNTFIPFVEMCFIDFFIEKYSDKKESFKILDPSTGWGDRLIGFLASKKGVEYIGFDPNQKGLEEGYKNILKDFCGNVVASSNNLKSESTTKKVNITFIPFEDSILLENYFDLTFTSPPFFDLEIYSNDPTQSVNDSTNTYEKWLEFYSTYLSKIVFATSSLIGIYVGDFYSSSSGKMINLVQDTIKLIEESNKFVLEKDISYFFNTTKPRNDREIYVFKRKEKEKETSLKTFPYHYNSLGNSFKDTFYKRIKDIKVKIVKSEPSSFFNIKSIESVNKKRFLEMWCKDVFEFKLIFPSNSTLSPNSNSSNSWQQMDILVDFYNEEARIKGKGFGEEISMYDYWVKHPSLTRDELYNKVTAPRPAYISSSKGLMTYIIDNLGCRSILDIGAYGDRMIAFSSVAKDNTFQYRAIDPDINLKYNNLIQDVHFYLNEKANIQFYPISFEECVLEGNDIVLISPPPYKAEKYTLSEKQSYNVYSNSFKDWVEGFLVNSIIRKSNEIFTYDKEAYLAFTALDRVKENINKDFEIAYVELLCLLIELCSDFSFHTLLLFGDSKIPWFFFRKKEKTEEYYGKRFNILVKEYSSFSSSKIIQNLIKDRVPEDVLASYYIKKESIENLSYLTSSQFFKNVKNEKIRHSLVMWLCNILFLELNEKVSFDRLVTLIARYLMMSASFCTPLERFLSCDTFFVDITSNEVVKKECNEQLISSILEKEKSFSKEDLEFIMKEKRYMFECYNYKEIVKGFDGLIRACGIFMYYITLTTIDYTEFKYPFSPNKTFFNEKDSYSDQRYSALGAVSHHFTRPLDRAQILINSLGENSVTDIFATTFNSNSINTPYYFSLYPDVEENSLGNVFYIDSIKSGFYLCNAMDIPFYTVYTASFLNKFLKEKDSEITFYVSFVVWKDTREYKKIISKDFENFESENKGLKEHFKLNKKYLKACVILDKEKFPTVSNPNDKKGFKTSRADTSISFGIILSNKKNFNIDINTFSLLGEYTIF